MHLGEEEVFTAAEVAKAIKGIKSGKVEASQRLANRCDYSDIQERRSQATYELQRDNHFLVWQGKWMLNALKENAKK